jgi:hypothetical protein
VFPSRKTEIDHKLLGASDAQVWMNECDFLHI